MTEDIESINRRWFEAVDEGDWETVRELLSPDFQIHFPPSLGLAEGPVDRDTFIDLLKHFEFRHVIHDMLSDGEKVATRVEINLKQLEEFQGIPPGDEEISTQGILIRRFENGLIAEEWIAEDTLAFMNQMGIVDIPEA